MFKCLYSASNSEYNCFYLCFPQHDVHIHLEKSRSIASSNQSHLACRDHTCPKCAECCDWKYRGGDVYVSRGVILITGIYGDYVTHDGATFTRVGVDPLGATVSGSDVYHGSNRLCKCKKDE